MYKLRIHRTIVSVRDAWRRLERNGGDQRSVYQSYRVNAIVKKRMPIYALQGKYSTRYVELLEDGETCMILPICKYHGSNRYCSIGRFNGYQVYDFIYTADMTPEKMSRCLAFVLKELNVESLSLSNVPHHSVLFTCLSTPELTPGGYQAQWTSNDNVTIDTGLDYEQWHSGLSKSTRQNLRTAYNRMNTDGVSRHFVLYQGEKMPARVLDQIIDLYCKRHSARYNEQVSPLKKWYLRHLDFSTACMRSDPDNFYALLYLNDQPAAFLSGMVEKAGSSAIIPRLSIEDEFSKYSPGMVLVNETIQRMIPESNTRYLDLSKGTEKYKLSMGGTLYHTHHIELNRQPR